LTPKAANFQRIRRSFTPDWVPVAGLNYRQLHPYRLFGTVATPRLWHFFSGLREIEHAWTDCPLGPQRFDYHHGIADDRNGHFSDSIATRLGLLAGLDFDCPRDLHGGFSDVCDTGCHQPAELIVVSRCHSTGDAGRGLNKLCVFHVDPHSVVD
jgi:hypothetical protein